VANAASQVTPLASFTAHSATALLAFPIRKLPDTVVQRAATDFIVTFVLSRRAQDENGRPARREAT